jgi:hypothetical protein
MLDCFVYANLDSCSCAHVQCNQNLKGWVQGEQIGSYVVFLVYKQERMVTPGIEQLQCIN